MTEIINIRDQIRHLISEIEQDKSELSQVPIRFQESIKTAIVSKENKLIELNEQLKKLNEIFRVERLNKIVREFENYINQFFENYRFAEEGDKEHLQSQIFIDFENGKAVVSLTNEDENLIRRKLNKEKIRITFPNGTSIEELKTTDSFTKAIVAIGISKVEQLNIRVLKLPLIGKIKSEKYQQREILPNTYLVTQISNEKKIEILENISERLSLNMNVEII